MTVFVKSVTKRMICSFYEIFEGLNTMNIIEHPIFKSIINAIFLIMFLVFTSYLISSGNIKLLMMLALTFVLTLLIAKFEEKIMVLSIVGILIIIYTLARSIDIVAYYGIFLGCLSLYFISRNLDNIFKNVNSTILLLVSFFLFLIVVNMVIAPDQSLAIKAGVRIIVPIISALLFSVLFKKQIDIRRFIRVLYYALVLLLLLPNDVAFILKGGEWERFRGFFVGGTAHTFAHFLTILMLFSLYYSDKKKSAYIVLINSLILLLATNIRTAIVTATIFCGTYAISSKKGKPLVAIIVLFLFVISVPSFRDLLWVKFSEFFQSSPLSYSDEIGSGRVGIWKHSYHYFRHQSFFEQILGSGMYSQHFTLEKFYGQPLDAHNDYLSLLIQTGILGLTIYCILLFYCIIKSLMLLRKLEKEDEDRRTYCLLFAFAFGVLISNFASNSYVNRFQLAMFFWPLMGYLIGFTTAGTSSEAEKAEVE